MNIANIFLNPESKYAKWYISIINKAILRQNGLKQTRAQVKKQKFDEYVEIHHIIPKSLGGTNEYNLVALTAKEHFIAHMLLYKGTKTFEMACAFHRMAFSSENTNNRKKITSSIFNNLKRNLSQLRKENMSGSNHWNFGKNLDIKTKEKISTTLSGHIQSDETITKRKNTIADRRAAGEYEQRDYSFMQTPEYSNAMSIACKGVIKTPEWNRKNAEANMGKVHVANTKLQIRKRLPKEEAAFLVNTTNGEWIYLATMKPIPPFVQSPAIPQHP